MFRKAASAVCFTALPLVARRPLEVALVPCRGRAEGGLWCSGFCFVDGMDRSMVFWKAAPAVCCTALPHIARPPLDIALVSGRGCTKGGVGVLTVLLPRRQVQPLLLSQGLTLEVCRTAAATKGQLGFSVSCSLDIMYRSVLFLKVPLQQCVVQPLLLSQGPFWELSKLLAEGTPEGELVCSGPCSLNDNYRSVVFRKAAPVLCCTAHPLVARPPH